MSADVMKVRPRGRTFSFFRSSSFFRSLLLPALLVFGWGGTSAGQAGDPGRCEYLAKAGGFLCFHTKARKDATPFAVGRELKTPFDTFYCQNITPHPTRGIGS